MPNFKYTVANKSGKKLSGTVEAPDEKIAREELKNLGFSILSLQETSEATKLASHLTKFVFEGYDKNSKLVSGTIPAKTKEEKYEQIKIKKAVTSVEDLCKGFPKEFEPFLNYTRKLKFEEKPDY